MSTAPAALPAYSHTAGDLALAYVSGGSERAVQAASQILASHANDMGLGEHRTMAVNDNKAKDTAALFAMNFGAAGLNFANVLGGDKAPASAPDVSGRDSSLSV